MKTDFDVVIVGAGPAGMATAHELNRLGYKLLLLDRCRFPRVKPCGGGLSIKALNLIPWSVAPTLERAAKKIHVGMKQATGDHFELVEGNDFVCGFAVRKDFDRFNLEKVTAEGVEFEVENALSRIDETQSHVQVTLERKLVTTRFVVGADGANSLVRRLIATRNSVRYAFAIEGIVSYGELPCEPVTQLFFGYVKNGYGWLFPKSGHVNVGLYTSDGAVTLSKEQLRAYALDQLGTNRVEAIVGYPIGFGSHDCSSVHQRIILAGDAGGFAEPLLGEGIHNALKSGQAAASAIVSCDHNGSHNLRTAYDNSLGPLKRDLACCERLARRFYPNLDRIGFDALGLTIGKTLLMRGFAAGMTIHEMTDFRSLSPFRLFRPFYKPKVTATLREFIERERKLTFSDGIAA